MEDAVFDRTGQGGTRRSRPLGASPRPTPGLHESPRRYRRSVQSAHGGVWGAGDHEPREKRQNRCWRSTPSGAHRGRSGGPQRTGGLGGTYLCGGWGVPTYVAKIKGEIEGEAPICGGVWCGGWAVCARRRQETSSADPPSAIRGSGSPVLAFAFCSEGVARPPTTVTGLRNKWKFSIQRPAIV